VCVDIKCRLIFVFKKVVEAAFSPGLETPLSPLLQTLPLKRQSLITQAMSSLSVT